MKITEIKIGMGMYLKIPKLLNSEIYWGFKLRLHIMTNFILNYI